MSKHPETAAIHSLKRKIESGDPVITPETRSTIFKHTPSHQNEEYQYTRAANPNRTELEDVLATLEHGEACAAFSSGMAATAAIFQALNPGDHVLIPNDLYHGTRSYLKDVMSRWGLTYTEVDMTNLQQVEDVIKPETRMIWAETPSNPLLHITDLEKLSELAKKNNCLLTVDNTWPSPINLNPLGIGADLVMHSTTKYLGGHSDLLGGAVVAKTESGVFEIVREIQKKGGAVPSPSDCWLLVRSIKTLPVRMEAHNRNADKVANYLDSHPSVEKVFYPGLSSHPGYNVAKNQMRGFGAMISFLIKGSAEDALNVVNSSQMIMPATSLGGVESTWEHRRSVEGDESKTPESLIRLSVGIEHVDDILKDLESSLAAVK